MDDAVFVHERAWWSPRQSVRGRASGRSAHVMAGASIGADCNVCEHTFIEDDVVIGDWVTIKSGVFL